MADLLQTGLAWLSGQLRANASQTVTYARGASSVTVQAVYGQKLLKLDDGRGGIRMEWVDMDFLIDANDLTFDGGVTWVTPQRGDLIAATVNGEAQTFEVRPYGSDAPWRWSDPHQTMYRIHTKQVQ